MNTRAEAAVVIIRAIVRGATDPFLGLASLEMLYPTYDDAIRDMSVEQRRALVEAGVCLFGGLMAAPAIA